MKRKNKIISLEYLEALVKQQEMKDALLEKIKTLPEVKNENNIFKVMVEPKQ